MMDRKAAPLHGFVDAGTAWNHGYSYTDGLALTSAGAGARRTGWSLDEIRSHVATLVLTLGKRGSVIYHGEDSALSATSSKPLTSAVSWNT